MARHMPFLGGMMKSFVRGAKEVVGWRVEILAVRGAVLDRVAAFTSERCGVDARGALLGYAR